MGGIQETQKWLTGLQDIEKLKCWIWVGGLSLGVNL